MVRCRWLYFPLEEMICEKFVKLFGRYRQRFIFTNAIGRSIVKPRLFKNILPLRNWFLAKKFVDDFNLDPINLAILANGTLFSSLHIFEAASVYMSIVPKKDLSEDCIGLDLCWILLTTSSENIQNKMYIKATTSLPS